MLKKIKSLKVKIANIDRSIKANPRSKHLLVMQGDRVESIKSLNRLVVAHNASVV